MPILLLIILFACLLGLVLALITLSLRRISGRVIEQYGARLNDADTIVNGGRAPESWVQPIRQRIEAGPRGRPESGNSSDAVQRMQKKGRQQCLKRLKSLIAFMEKGQFYDGEETRAIVLKELRTQQDRWASCDWAELLPHENAEETSGTISAPGR